MDKIKEKLSNWLTFFSDHIKTFNVVEKYKNVVYFSKFTLESEELFKIHNFILTLKINLIRSLFDQFKYSVYNIVAFKDKNLNERGKMIALYSACFLNYYKKFLYDTSHEFEEYYDQSFLNLVKTFGIDIKNNELFKVLSFWFFNKMKSEIINLHYDSNIKPLKYIYESNINGNGGKEVINNNKNINNNLSKDSIDISNKMAIEDENPVKNRAINFVVSTKEKIVDIIYEIKYRKQLSNLFSNNEVNNLNLQLNQLNNISVSELDCLYKTFEKEKIKANEYDDTFNMSTIDDKTSVGINELFNNSINLNINQSFNKMTEIDSSDSFKSNMDFINTIKNKNKNSNDINNFNNKNKSNTINEIKEKEKEPLNKINITPYSSPIHNPNKSAFKPINNISNKDNMYSHRLMSELVKNKIEDKTMGIIIQVAKMIDEQLLDHLLKNEQKPILIMDSFSCYIANFEPKVLKSLFPEYNEVLENIHIKFIILAKNLYNKAMELFCSIYDLTSTNVNRFLDLANICGIHLKYAKGIYNLFKDYSTILLEKNSLHDLKKTVDKFVEMERLNWEKIVNKGTSFFQE